ncbi:MAG: hypothetical protein JSU77_11840 [Fidelibacterota bacterium]|nr:MAG: hypothetical protein JSU77_11840 [Candidatus Neomarinimicrobiota bacterium]
MDHFRPGMPGAVVGEGILPDVLGVAGDPGARFGHGGNIWKREGLVVRLVRLVRLVRELTLFKLAHRGEGRKGREGIED